MYILFTQMIIGIETAIWAFNPLAPIEVHNMEKNPGIAPLRFFDWRKKDMNFLDDDYSFNINKTEFD